MIRIVKQRRQKCDNKQKTIRYLIAQANPNLAKSGSKNFLFRALDYQSILKAHFGGPLKFANSLQTRGKTKRTTTKLSNSFVQCS
jgi:hypothetical protein